jgi:FkbM family methyltransferase
MSDLNSAYNGEGEDDFFSYIKDTCKTIFDVGCFAGTYENGDRAVNVFTHLEDVDVHYFDPVPEFINEVSKQVKNRDRSYLNKFGLSNKTGELPYYTEVMSFVERSKTLPHRKTEPDRTLSIKRGDEYVKEHNIKSIDFLKIDVEGFEKGVIEGFGSFIKNVKIVQFEYGGCWIDNEVKLAEVVNPLKQAGFANFGRIFKSGVIPLEESLQDDYKFSNIVCHNTKNYKNWTDDKFKK